jgi:methyl-accepting chemotaxis protein
MRVGPRIVLAIALLAIAGAIAVLLVLPATTALQSRYDTMQQRSLETRTVIAKLEALAERTAASRYALLLTGRPSDRDILIGTQRQWDLALGDLHNRLADQPAALRRLDEIGASVDQFDRSVGASLLDAATDRMDHGEAARIASAVRDNADRTQVGLEGLRRAEAEAERMQTAALHEYSERWHARIGVAALVLIGLALFIAIFLTYGVFSPLVELARLAESIAAGDRPKLQWTRRDELGEVARSIATMSHVLDARDQDLEKRSGLV